MYKGASDLAQSRNGRQVVVDAMIAGGRNEERSTRDEWASVQSAMRNIRKRMDFAPRGSSDRAKLLKQLQALERRSRDLKLKLFGPQARPGHLIGEYFINAARDQLPKPTFDLIMKAANRALDTARVAFEASAPASDPDIAG